MAGLKRMKKGDIDTPLTHFGPFPGLKTAAGIYDKHPNVGPGAADASVPVKFFDEAVKTTMQPLVSGQEFTPAQTKKS